MTSLAELMSLKGKRALVTGGAGHLGFQIADALAELGSDLVIASRDQERCRRAADELATRHGVGAEAIPLDLTDRASIIDCVNGASATADFHILVMCAWSGKKNSFDSITDADWDHDIEVCLNGVFRMIKAAAPVLERTRGVILNVGSMYGHVAPDYRLYEDVPQTNPPSYGAAKAGIIQLTRYLASFLAPRGIRVNCISPGPFPFPSVVEQYPDFAARLAAKNPLGRIGQPHEIKGAAALLCTDASSYMTGQNVCVDGGWTVW